MQYSFALNNQSTRDGRKDDDNDTSKLINSFAVSRKSLTFLIMLHSSLNLEIPNLISSCLVLKCPSDM